MPAWSDGSDADDAGFGGRGSGRGPGFGGGGCGRGRHRPGCGCPRRARRGDVRAALLALLVERPMHGYEMISELAERTGGAWMPSPGAVYPALQLLAEERLVDSETDGGRRRYMLTDAGRQAVEDPSFAGPPWESMSRPMDPADTGLREAAALTSTALAQVIAAGTPEQKSRALEILVSARRALYRILAEDDPDH